MNTIILKETHVELIINSPKYGIKTVLIDLDDVNKVKKFKWFIRPENKIKNRFYIETFIYNKNKKMLKLHRYITNCPDDLVVDHINRNTLDNRKCNLRICTHLENMQNRNVQKDNKLGLKYISKDRNYFRFSITRNKINFSRRFKTLEECLLFRNNYIKERGIIL